MEVTTNNYDITNKNLIAHLRFVAIIFQRPVSASYTESRLKILIFIFLKKLFQWFIHHNFHIVNNTPCLPPKFCMRIVFNFFLE